MWWSNAGGLLLVRNQRGISFKCFVREIQRAVKQHGTGHEERTVDGRKRAGSVRATITLTFSASLVFAVVECV